DPSIRKQRGRVVPARLYGDDSAGAVLGRIDRQRADREITRSRVADDAVAERPGKNSDEEHGVMVDGRPDGRADAEDTPGSDGQEEEIASLVEAIVPAEVCRQHEPKQSWDGDESDDEPRDQSVARDGRGEREARPTPHTGRC